MKKLFKLAFLTFAFISRCHPSISQCSPCLTPYLILNTSYDHAKGDYYHAGEVDQYWTLIQGPVSHGPYPRCANARDGFTNHFPSPLNPCGCISASPSGVCDGNMEGNVNNCHFNGEIPYVFSRTFCVNTGKDTINANLNLLRVWCDLNLSSINIYGPTGSFNVNSFCHDQGAFTIPTFNFPITTGVYSLQFTLGNDW